MDSMLPAILNKSSLLPIEFLSGNLVTRCMYEIAEFQSADELVEKGHKERKAKRYRNALELYEKALTVDPRHEFALFWAGFCLLPTKEWKAIINELYGTRRSLAIGRSIGYYQKLLHIVEEKRPEDVETMGNCYVNIGVGYNLLDDAAKAEKCWQKAIDLNEDDFAYCYLGWFRKRMGREDEAIVLLNNLNP